MIKHLLCWHNYEEESRLLTLSWREKVPWIGYVTFDRYLVKYYCKKCGRIKYDRIEEPIVFK